MKDFVLNNGKPYKVNIKKWDAFRLICCDCSLVHIVLAKISGEVLTLRFYRDDEYTQQVRLEDEKV